MSHLAEPASFLGEAATLAPVKMASSLFDAVRSMHKETVNIKRIAGFVLANNLFCHSSLRSPFWQELWFMHSIC